MRSLLRGNFEENGSVIASLVDSMAKQSVFVGFIIENMVQSNLPGSSTKDNRKPHQLGGANRNRGAGGVTTFQNQQVTQNHLTESDFDFESGKKH